MAVPAAIINQLCPGGMLFRSPRMFRAGALVDRGLRCLANNHRGEWVYSRRFRLLLTQQWRPSPDVRTIAEVFLHASAANYNLYKLVGTPTPAGVDTKTLEQSTTEKARVIATLKASYAHAKAAIRSMLDADLEKTLEWNGGKITERGVLLYIVQHIAQHLGQQIAYARSIGVVPPWTLDPPRKN